MTKLSFLIPFRRFSHYRSNFLNASASIGSLTGLQSIRELGVSEMTPRPKTNLAYILSIGGVYEHTTFYP
jgi:hypothetical protein